MKKLLAVCAVLGMFSVVAFGEEQAAPKDADTHAVKTEETAPHADAHHADAHKATKKAKMTKKKAAVEAPAAHTEEAK